MNAPGIQLVVFDLGGVVVRICRSWQQACQATGLDFRPRVAEAELIARRKLVSRRYETGSIDDATFYLEMSRSMDGLYTPEEVRNLHLAWILGEYDGIGAAIESLHNAGVATGVLSNTNASHWRQLTSGPHGPAKFPTVERAQHVHASHLLGLAKPDRAIYEAFCSRVGVDPARVLFFDDLAENVAAARSAGWRSEQIDHQGDPAAQVRTWLGRHGVV